MTTLVLEVDSSGRMVRRLDGLDKSKGRVLAFNFSGELLDQGDDAASVSRNARKTCKCPVIVMAEAFDDTIYEL
jgi:hypothetical protein